MSDYELQLKVKNAPLLNVMRSRGLESAADLSRFTGLSQNGIGDILNLKTTLYNKFGKIRPQFKILSEALKILPEDLIPESHWYCRLEKNTFSAQVDAYQLAEIGRDAAKDPLKFTPVHRAMNGQKKSVKVAAIFAHHYRKNQAKWIFSDERPENF